MGTNIESWYGDCDRNESRSTVAAEQADLRRGEEADWRQTQNSSTSQLDRKKNYMQTATTVLNMWK